jgi:ribulose-phosphate 3-epimerase
LKKLTKNVGFMTTNLNLFQDQYCKKENIILSPSLLSADFTRLGEQVTSLERAGANWLHFDVMDGHFAPNISMGPLIIKACSSVTSLPFDVHMMVENPEYYIADFAKAGANLITIHIETGYHPYRTIQLIRSLGCRPGIALNPGTSLAAITELIPLVDMVLVLGTNPGFSGQTFLPQMLSKITAIRKERLDLLIQVDGGMSRETIPTVIKAGANVIVAGNAVFNHPEGIEKGVKALKALFEEMPKD